MRRITAFILCLALLPSFASCGKKQSKTDVAIRYIESYYSGDYVTALSLLASNSEKYVTDYIEGTAEIRNMSMEEMYNEIESRAKEYYDFELDMEINSIDDFFTASRKTKEFLNNEKYGSTIVTASLKDKKTDVVKLSQKEIDDRTDSAKIVFSSFSIGGKLKIEDYMDVSKVTEAYAVTVYKTIGEVTEEHKVMVAKYGGKWKVLSVIPSMPLL